LQVVSCRLSADVVLWRGGRNTGVLHCVQDDDIVISIFGGRDGGIWSGCGAGSLWSSDDDFRGVAVVVVLSGFFVGVLVFVLLGREDGVGGEVGWGWDGERGGEEALVGGEVLRGDLEGLEEESGSLEVHVIAGEAGGYVGDGLLDDGAVVEAGDEEGVVLQDGGDVVVAVVVAHDLVVHGGGAAAGSVLFGVVHAAMGTSWVELEFSVE
jgi:hypothetical protein